MNHIRTGVTNILRTRILNTIHYEERRNMKRWTVEVMKKMAAEKAKEKQQAPIVRSSFLEWNRNSEVYAFNARLSENFNLSKLEHAFTHKSYIIQEEMKQMALGIETPKLDLPHNMVLIENGRQFVSEIVYKYLYESFPQAPEEAIRSFHDYLLSEEVLAYVSSHLGTKDLILSDEYPPSNQTLANTFFAIVSALVESVDQKHASIFIRDFLFVLLAEKDLNEIWSPSDPLAIVNDLLSKQKRGPAEPRLIGHSGKTTVLSVYHIGIYSDKQYLDAGFGQTIEEAQHAAAMKTLFRLAEISDSSNTIKFNKEIC